MFYWRENGLKNTVWVSELNWDKFTARKVTHNCLHGLFLFKRAEKNPALPHSVIKGINVFFPYGPIEEPTQRIILDEIHVTTTAINLLMRRQRYSIAAALILKKQKTLKDGWHWPVD